VLEQTDRLFRTRFPSVNVDTASSLESAMVRSGYCEVNGKRVGTAGNEDLCFGLWVSCRLSETPRKLREVPILYSEAGFANSVCTLKGPVINLSFVLIHHNGDEMGIM
jgi:hypothetical protein